MNRAGGKEIGKELASSMFCTDFGSRMCNSLVHKEVAYLAAVVRRLFVLPL